MRMRYEIIPMRGQIFPHCRAALRYAHSVAMRLRDHEIMNRRERNY
jgi:hypothetical protein